MNNALNYRHLYYFWMVATEGSMVGAAKRLHVTIQTISTQVKQLEQEIGYGLFKPDGRGLRLTEAGVAALQEADHIFAIGEALPAKVRAAVRGQVLHFHVGISDGIAKLAVNQLLAPILHEEHLHLVCHDGEVNQLLPDLAVHKLDLVIADQVPSSGSNFKLHHSLLRKCPVAWYATPVHAEQALVNFPQALSELPVLLPTAHHAVRNRINHWFENQRISPNVVGEFEDSALLTTFGVAGMGIFPAPSPLHNYLTAQNGLIQIASCGDVTEYFHAIYSPRKVKHKLLSQLLQVSAE